MSAMDMINNEHQPRGVVTPRRVFIAAAAAVALAAVSAIFFPRMFLPPQEEIVPGQVSLPEGSPTLTSLDPDEPAETALAVPTSPSKAAATAVPSVPKKSYGDVVAEFNEGGRRVQFFYNAQGSCQVAPSWFALARESLLMLDNRSNRRITAVIDGQTYALPAYQYHVARMKFPRGPGEYPIHCGSQFNAGTVMVQP